MPTLDSEQRKIVKAIIAESRQISDPAARRKFKRAAVQTGLVESNLRNLSYGDADSQGWRQERMSIYGAGATGATNVKASVRRFREEFLAHYDPGERASDVAGQVQRPASQYLGRYQERAGEARAILSGYGGGGTDRPTRLSGRPDTLRITPGVDRSAERQVMLQDYLAERGKPGALLALKSGLDNTADTPGYQEVIPGRPGRQRQPRKPDAYQGKVTVAPGANRPGVDIDRSILRFLREVSDRANQPITVGTGTAHSQYTVSGNVSDHWGGQGADVPATGAELVRLGRKALRAAGMSKAQVRKVTGGLFNVNGYQIIFNTDEGGNHRDHLHVGYREGR